MSEIEYTSDATTITTTITPQILAEMFAALSDVSQAQFFNEFGRISRKWGGAAKLKEAIKLNDQLRDWSNVRDHFLKAKTHEDPIEFIVRYLKECNNLGTSTIRKEIAEMLFGATLTFLDSKVIELEKKFEIL